MDLSKPLPKGESQKIYVVHRGSIKNDKTGDEGLVDTVCTRLSKEDADGVAQALNDAYEGVMYLKWIASKFFPLATGSGDALLEKANEPDVGREWNTLIDGHRQQIYSTTELTIMEEEDIKEFRMTLDEESVRTKTQ